MIVQITPAEVKSKKLFDGLEKDLFNNTFKIVISNIGEVIINPNDMMENNFNKLNKDFIEVISSERNFEFENGLFPGYIGTDNLDLKYLFIEDTLLIFSLGEYQPARYKLYFEGAWLKN